MARILDWSDRCIKASLVEGGLPKPDTRAESLSLLVDIVNTATPKDIKLLTEDCDCILECRVCRNLFRKVDDFRKHKNSYCKPDINEGKKDGVSYSIDSADSAYAQPKSVVQLNDEVFPARMPADVNSYVHVKPLLKLADGTTICRQYMNTGSGSEDEDDFMARYKRDKKDTVVLDTNGKVIGTGTKKDMEIVAEEVGRKASIMMDEGIDLSSRRTQIRSLLGKTSKRTFNQRGRLNANQRDCGRSQMAFKAQQAFHSEEFPSPSTCNSRPSTSWTSNATSCWTPNTTGTPKASRIPNTTRTPKITWIPNTTGANVEGDNFSEGWEFN